VDFNKDGIQQPGEPGLANVAVELYTAYNNKMIRSTTTDRDGYYSFKYLPPKQEYYVKFILDTLNGEYFWTDRYQGNDPRLDSDVDTNGLTRIFTFENNDLFTEIDAGVWQYGALGDLVWEDMNGDGIQDPNEPPMPNIVVELRDPNNNNVLDTTVTDSSGRYKFTDLQPGRYYLAFRLGASLTGTRYRAGSDRNTDSDILRTFNGIGITGIIFLDPDESDLSIDAGVYYCIELGDYVWFDINKDGLQDKFEGGLNNIWVYLVDTANVVVDSTLSKKNNFTDRDGYFNMCVPPGKYFLRFQDVDNITATLPQVGNDPTIDSDITNQNGKNTTDTFSVVSRQVDYHWDAGFKQGFIIQGVVWNDPNENSRKDDGEQWVENVLVELYDTTGMMVTSGSSNWSGAYDLGYLFDERYTVRVITPPGYEAQLKEFELKRSENGFSTLEIPIRRLGDKSILLGDDGVKDHKVVLFPNPALHDLNVRFKHYEEGSARVSIFDANGKQVLFFIMNGLSDHQIVEDRLDIRSLPKGAYLVQVTIGESNYYEQLIVGD
jgi:5-hydroxyisourate hydrolase-like protein (transthyretin family)